MQINHDNEKAQEALMNNIRDIAEELESKPAPEILRWGFKKYGEKMVLASSFGAEDVVLIDMMVKINRNLTRVFTLDTGRLNQETYDLIDKIRKKYDINICLLYTSDAADERSSVDLGGRRI